MMSIEERLVQTLAEMGLTISTAESCTGGMVASSIIDVAGASDVYNEGFITYSNEAKMNRLGVKKETLDRYGAVSEETAREMANGIARESGSRIAISTTGLAGPGGGSTEKPVGLVYIGIYLDGETIIRKFNFSGERNKIRKDATVASLNMLLDILTERKYL